MGLASSDKSEIVINILNTNEMITLRELSIRTIASYSVNIY